VKQIKDEWGGKVILKGILDAEDAKMALKVGADAIIVSNHGGRQLDGALAQSKHFLQFLTLLVTKLKFI
jgi:L-lactate dehydrogenase (cytochrome)